MFVDTVLSAYELSSHLRRSRQLDIYLRIHTFQLSIRRSLAESV